MPKPGTVLLELDHVLLAVSDLDVGAAEAEARYGLASFEGGRHPGWGTANRIVPLGDTYLELVSVVDAAEAAASAFGRWISSAAAPHLRPLGWAVRTDALETVARRLRLTPQCGSRLTSDGQRLSWRVAGIEQAAKEPSLPFFIEWAPGTPFPGGTPARHRRGPVSLARLEIRGDAERHTAWLGRHDLPVTCADGAPAITRVILNAPECEIALGRR
jgi:hypothetical protein